MNEWTIVLGLITGGLAWVFALYKRNQNLEARIIKEDIDNELKKANQEFDNMDINDLVKRANDRRGSGRSDH